MYDYTKSPWPKWQYHCELCPNGRIVNSQEEYESLGPGWVDSPALFPPSENPPPFECKYEAVEEPKKEKPPKEDHPKQEQVKESAQPEATPQPEAKPKKKKKW